jgi:predicted transcriptional regulator
MSNAPNAERYKHIPTAEILRLFDQGLSDRKIGKALNMGPDAVKNRREAEGIVRSAKKLTALQLEAARADPAWQARIENRSAVPADKVVCLECGELKSALNANRNHSHLRGEKHKMKPEEYLKKYPCARLTSFERSADQNRRQGRAKTTEDLMDECAGSFLRPVELKTFIQDQEHEEHHHIEDFVACRLCGFKSKSDLHLHLKARHELASAAYRKLFPKALQLPLGLYEDKNALAREYGEKKRMVLKRYKVGDLIASPVIDRERIALIARLELEGRKETHEMVADVYPPAPGFASLHKREQKLDRTRRKDKLKKFRKYNRKRIDLEKKRQTAERASTSIAF